MWPPVGSTRTIKSMATAGNEAMARWLSPNGTAVLCAQAPQRARVLAAAERVGLTANLELQVIPKADKRPLVAVFVLSRGETQARREQLIVRGKDGQWTAEFRAVRTALGMP